MSLLVVCACSSLVRGDWDMRVSLDERYDDNITQLSQRDLDRLAASGGGMGFECGSGSTLTSGGRFTITTPDDYVTNPRVSTTFRAGWLEERPTSFEADLTAYQYATNRIKDHQSYRFAVSQPLNRSRYQTSITGIYSLIPRSYVRNLRSDETAQELGVLPPPRREATYSSQTRGFQVEQEIVNNHLRARALLGDEVRNYNSCFDERDSRMPFRELDLTYDPFRKPWLRLRLTYRREDLRAAGDLASTPLLKEGDVSSARRILGWDARVQWGRKGRKKTLRFRSEAEHRDYLATSPNDIFHFDRTDERRYSTLTVRVDLKRGWFLTAEAERDRNRSSFPVTPGSTFQPDETTDYTEQIAQFGIGYDFGFGRGGGSEGKPPTPRD